MKSLFLPISLFLISCVTHSTKEISEENSSCVTPFSLMHFETRQPSVVRLFFTLNQCDGDGVTGKTNEDIVLTENDTDLNIFESLQQIIPASIDYDIRTVLLLDMSGSMINSGTLPQVQDAAWVFVSRLTEHQKVAIYIFDGRQQIQEIVNFTQNPIVLRAAIDSLADYESQDNSTKQS